MSVLNSVNDCYWVVGDNQSQRYSSTQQTYVPYDNEGFTDWLAKGGIPRRIANEVELQDVLLKAAPQAALQRSFTCAEVLAALIGVDRAKVCEAFEVNDPANIAAAETAERAATLVGLLKQFQMSAVQISF